MSPLRPLGFAGQGAATDPAANPCRVEWWSLDPAVLGAWAGAYTRGDIRWRERGRTREGGVDCWGLLHLVYRERLGIVLPDYASEYTSTADRADLARLIAREKGDWIPVWESRTLRGIKRAPGAREAPPKGVTRPFDAVLLPIQSHPCHVGVAAGGTSLLHIAKGAESAVDDWTVLKWAACMARGGIYRHRALAEAS
jgi:cell wall-associated NlpC family hydrolase